MLSTGLNLYPADGSIGCLPLTAVRISSVRRNCCRAVVQEINIMRIFVKVIFIFFTIVYLCVANDDQTVNKNDCDFNQEDVLRIAVEYTGFEISKAIDTEKKLVHKIEKNICVDSTTPFVKDMLNQKEVWIVTFDSVYLKYEKWDPALVKKYTPQSFKVYVSPETGKLLKIISEKTAGSLLPLEPVADTAEKILKLHGEEFHELPDAPPKISFYQALEAAAFCNPLIAKEIVAIYILHSRMGSDTKPVWFITGKGVPAMPSFSQDQGDSGDSEENIRCVVDATTGDLMFVTNRPY